jgi:hypothetical protein
MAACGVAPGGRGGGGCRRALNSCMWLTWAGQMHTRRGHRQQIVTKRRRASRTQGHPVFRRRREGEGTWLIKKGTVDRSPLVAGAMNSMQHAQVNAFSGSQGSCLLAAGPGLLPAAMRSVDVTAAMWSRGTRSVPNADGALRRGMKWGLSLLVQPLSPRRQSWSDSSNRCACDACQPYPTP